MNVATTSVDPWDKPIPGSSTGWKPTPRAPVRDDWDDDDEDEEQDSQKIWESANARAPMPQLVIAPSSASGPVHPAAFQAPIKILKRNPASSGASTERTQGAMTENSYAEREAKYQAARQRIFAEAEGRKGGGEGGEEGGERKVGMVRRPKGPEVEVGDGDEVKGFGKEGRGRGDDGGWAQKRRLEGEEEGQDESPSL